MRWIRPRRFRDGSCRKSFSSCGGRWKHGWGNGAGGNMCKCYACWKRFRWLKSAPACGKRCAFRHLLRCGQTPGVVLHRATAGSAGSGELSTSTAGKSGADAGGRLPGVAGGGRLMDTPRVLLEHYLKQLRLPTIVREFPKLAEQCAKEGATFEQFLLRLVEQEMLERERRATERRIKAAKFPVSKSLETYDFLAIPSLNKKLVVELARCEWIGRRENVLALGNSGTGKTHIGLALALAACQQGFRVRFATAASLVHELIDARDEKRLLRYQKHLARQELLMVDELGFVPLSKTGPEMLFEVVTQRYDLPP